MQRRTQRRSKYLSIWAALSFIAVWRDCIYTWDHLKTEAGFAQEHYAEGFWATAHQRAMITELPISKWSVWLKQTKLYQTLSHPLPNSLPFGLAWAMKSFWIVQVAVWTCLFPGASTAEEEDAWLTHAITREMRRRSRESHSRSSCVISNISINFQRNFQPYIRYQFYGFQPYRLSHGLYIDHVDSINSIDSISRHWLIQPIHRHGPHGLHGLHRAVLCLLSDGSIDLSHPCCGDRVAWAVTRILPVYLLSILLILVIQITILTLLILLIRLFQRHLLHGHGRAGNIRACTTKCSSWAMWRVVHWFSKVTRTNRRQHETGINQPDSSETSEKYWRFLPPRGAHENETWMWHWVSRATGCWASSTLHGAGLPWLGASRANCQAFSVFSARCKLCVGLRRNVQNIT